jgi:hypothetical protein
MKPASRLISREPYINDLSLVGRRIVMSCDVDVRRASLLCFQKSQRTSEILSPCRRYFLFRNNKHFLNGHHLIGSTVLMSSSKFSAVQNVKNYKKNNPKKNVYKNHRKATFLLTAFLLLSGWQTRI